MEVVHHDTNNFVLGPPSDGSMPDCKTIPATMLVTNNLIDGIVTWWQVNDAELNALREGQRILHYIWGTWIPKVLLQVEGGEELEPQSAPAFTSVEPGVFMAVWTPSPEELQAIRKSKLIKLFVFAGGFPPTALCVEGVTYAQ